MGLIVMGSTGRSGLPRILLGSTAETVARRATCSVLTVKREDVLAVKLEGEVSDLNRLLIEGQELLEQGLYQEAIGGSTSACSKTRTWPRPTRISLASPPWL